MSDLPTEAWLAALSSLSGMGPARLRRLLAVDGAAQLWHRLHDRDTALVHPLGRSGDRLVSAWSREVRGIDVAACWRQIIDARIGVAAFGSAGFPTVFADDPEPPAVLFSRGDGTRIADRRVAIVGTRRCTRYGYDVARDLGAALAAAGVTVVSGLAAGIDAAAHAGALRSEGAAPVAVVGTGLDIVYPRSNGGLWRAVAEAGVIYSEAPLGTAPAPWRFPARNRLIAALAEVVVVVESHRKGGSMHTVAEAVARDRQVFAVPGPIRSPASVGTNQLLAEGCAPVCEVDDVLVSLGLTAPTRRCEAPEPPERLRGLLDAIGWSPQSFSQLVDVSGLDPATAAGGVRELVELGFVTRTDAWIERVAPI